MKLQKIKNKSDLEAFIRNYGDYHPCANFFMKTKIITMIALVLITSACKVKVDTDVGEALDGAIDRIEAYVDDAGNKISKYKDDFGNVHEIFEAADGSSDDSDIADQTEELDDLGEGNLIGRFSIIQNSCQAVPSMISLYSYDDSDAIDVVDINNATISRGEVTGQSTFMFVAEYRDELERPTGIINCYCDLNTDDLLVCNCVDDQNKACQIYGVEQ